MAFNIDNAMLDFIDNNKIGLFSKLMATANGFDLFSTYSDVNVPVTRVSITETKLHVQEGQFCLDLVASGSTDITYKDIPVCQISLVNDYCKADLQKTWLGENKVKGVNWDDLGDVQSYFVDEFKEAALQELGDMVWKGEGCVKGLYHQISGSTDIATGFTILTQSNIEDAIDALVLEMPVAMRKRKDLVLITSPEVLSMLYNSIKSSNYFHFVIEPDTNKVKYVSGGISFEINAIDALAGSTPLLLTFKENMKIVYSSDPSKSNIEWIPRAGKSRVSYMVLDMYLGVGFVSDDYVLTNF